MAVPGPLSNEENLIQGVQKWLGWLGFASQDARFLTQHLLSIATGYCMVFMQTVQLLPVLKVAKIRTNLVLKTAK